MKTAVGLNLARSTIAALALVSATVQAEDYLYETNNGTITITGYTGSGGDVSIPSTINGLPVTIIGDYAGGAFAGCPTLTSIGIPETVTEIRRLRSTGDDVPAVEPYAFYKCDGLKAINVDSLNPTYSSVDGVLLNKAQTEVLQCPAGKSGCYTIPADVATVGSFAFSGCSKLTAIGIPDGVTSIAGTTWMRASNWPKSGAFCDCTGLTNILIPASVTCLEPGAFYGCTNLMSITVSEQNPGYSTREGVLFNKDQTTLLECPGGKAGAYTVPAAATTVAYGAFCYCIYLTTISIPQSVTNFTGNGWYPAPFGGCNSLTGVYFGGNAPEIQGYVFIGADHATVYYLPGTTGWGTTFGGRPTAPWLLPYPVILTTSPNFGIQSNDFGFRISWATNATVVVEASTNLANPTWAPCSTNALVDGRSDFGDAEWTNYPGRFYRIRPL